MKKTITILLVLVMLLSLAACGGNQEADPNLGKYIGFEVNMLDEWEPIEEMFAEGENYVELQGGGKCALCLDGETINGEWTLEGTGLTMTLEGESMKGTLENGVITIDFMGMEVLMSFVKEGAEKPAQKKASAQEEPVGATEAPEEIEEPEADVLVPADLISKEEFEDMDAYAIADELAGGPDATTDDLLYLYTYYTYSEVDEEDGYYYSPGELDEAFFILDEEYGVELPGPLELFDYFVMDEDPMLRIFALQQVSELNNLDEVPELSAEDLEIIKERMLHDEDSMVRNAAVTQTRWVCGEYPEIQAACLEAAADPEPMVRWNVAYNLFWNNTLDGVDETAEVLIHDKNPRVRATACQARATNGYEDALPVLQEIMMDPELSDLHFTAANALVSLWYGYGHEPMEDAYRFTLDYIAGETLDSMAFTSLMSPFFDGINENWAEDAPWFDAEALKTILEEIAADPDAGSSIVSEATETLEALNAEET